MGIGLVHKVSNHKQLPTPRPLPTHTCSFVHLFLLIQIVLFFCIFKSKVISFSFKCPNADSLFCFLFFVGQLHEDVPTEEHPGNLTILMSKHFNSNSPQLINTTLYPYKHHLLPTSWCFAPQGEHPTMAGLKTNVGEEVLYIEFKTHYLPTFHTLNHLKQ